MNEDIVSRSTPLVFSGFGSKWFAETPSGEIAYGDSQGLYEWRRVRLPGGWMTSLRIQYSGGDQQASRDGQMLHSGPEGPGRDVAVHPYPHELGFQAALNPVRMN